MFEEKKLVERKESLFVESESKLHYIKCAPELDEYLKIWIKEPTWLQVEQAMNTVLKVDSKSQSMDLDLNAMYRYMVDNFIDRTEPNLSTVDILRLTPYVGNQLKEVLPNPFNAVGDLGKDEE